VSSYGHTFFCNTHYMATQLALKKFDFAKTGDNRVFLVLGKRSTGKSQIVADILYHKRHVPMGVLMSSTEEATGFFKGVTGVPDAYVYGDWQPDVVDSIIARQRRLSKEGRMKNCFIVLDDLAFNKSLFNSPQMRELMFNGRHYGILLIITAQFLGDLPTYFRSNVDYVVTCRTPGVQDRDRLYKNFFGCVPTFHMFQSIMQSTTEDFHVLCMDNTVQSNTLEDCIFWYKAPLRSASRNNFRVGCQAYHRFAQQRTRKDGTEVSPTLTNGKKPPVIVKRLGH